MRTRKVPFRVLVLAALALIGGTGISQTPQQRGRDVFDRGGTLHDAAVAGGGSYVAATTTNNGWVAFGNLKDAAHESRIIVVGTPIENVARISADGKSISTFYKISIERRLKGKYGEGETLTVALPGGKVRFDDGTTAQINTPGFPKMLNGNRYLLYLNPSGTNQDGTSKLIPAGGSQGIFELGADGKVRPFARSGIDPVGKYAGAQEGELLRQAELAAGENQQ